MSLPYDVVRCPAKNGCPDKERCARFTSPGRPDGMQAQLDASLIRSPERCGMFKDNKVAEIPNSMPSPALTYQSELYPASWHGKVPKRVLMAKTVTPDMEVFFKAIEGWTSDDFCEEGRQYYVRVNSHGAVEALLESGKRLGLKPYEFEVIEWHPVAEGQA